ncbi:Ig-like domain-containing protein [Rahnella sikkimica]|uniref:Big-1 domain-containing protein n=1 Tax=Rahnella sikkimica TaxID=1805933 RepID=A0A2L1UPJ4_9GAMM|nr:Ig-like domain-containing protein [Rahnella sikkimica]AVF34856.1 hypothetical protein BV494_07875 [Rahnella sikkimica]
MIKRFFAWLKSIYLHPAEQAESQPKENTVKLALVSIITSMLANGAAANTVQITLSDNADTIQPGAVVSFTADNGATVTPTSALTDANGQITASLVSSTVGASTLTATAADGTTASIQVYFVAVPAPVIDVFKEKPLEDDEDEADADEAELRIEDVRAIFVKLEHPVIEVWDEVVALAKKYL